MRDALRPTLWFVAGLGTYGVSAAHGPMWADSSKLTIYALARYYPTLNPGDHPAWSLLADGWFHLVPWLSAVRAAHLLSALAGAAAVALMWIVTFKHTQSAARAHTAAAVLLVAHAMWWSSSLAESYAPALALALASLVFEGKTTSTSAASGLFGGLALATHPFSIVITLPSLFRQRRKLSLWAAFATALAPVWLGVLHTGPDPLTGHVSGRAASWIWHIQEFLDPGRAIQGLGIVVALLALNLGPLGLWSLARGKRPSGASPSRPGLVVAAAYAGLLCLYSPFRLHLMILFLVAALLIALPPRLSRTGRVGHVCFQAAAYVLLPLILTAAGLGSLGVRRLPGRRNAWYFLCPIKAGDHGPGRYATALLAAAPHGAVILADFNPGAVLALVQRTRRLRPDVHLVPTAVDDADGAPDPVKALATRIDAARDAGHAVILADRWEAYYHTAGLASRFGLSLVPCGPGWRVVTSRRDVAPRRPLPPA
ncbi:MAG: hypothetical protein GXP48_02595 [Acidobacteria bacterium]|nr:hypothetical protein [Acidobacteriota bacterium]